MCRLKSIMRERVDLKWLNNDLKGCFWNILGTKKRERERERERDICLSVYFAITDLQTCSYLCKKCIVTCMKTDVFYFLYHRHVSPLCGLLKNISIFREHTKFWYFIVW